MSLKSAVARGLGWSGAEIWLSRALSVVVLLILARELTPGAFGLVAMATVFISLGNHIRDMGFRESVIQREDVSDQYVSTAFWGVLFLGILLTGTGVAAAPLVSKLYGEPDLIPILRALSFLFLAGAAGRIPEALLERDLHYRPLAIRSIAATVVGGGAGIVLALEGFGVWSLVARQLTAKSVDSALLLIAAPTQKLSLSFNRSDAGELFDFGSKIFGSQLLTFFEKKGDDFLIGAVLGPSALGVYDIAYRVLEYSSTVAISVAHRLALPVFSQIHQRGKELRQAFYRANRYLSAFAFPAFLGLAAVAGEVVPLIFGPGWSQSIPVLRWLAVGGVMRVLFTFDTPLLVSIGHPRDKLVLALIEGITALVFYAGAVYLIGTVIAVAAAYTLRRLFVWPVRVYAVKRRIGLDLGEYLSQFRVPVIASSVMVACVIGTLLAGPFDAAGDLALGVSAGTVIYVSVSWILDAEFLQQAYFAVSNVLVSER